MRSFFALALAGAASATIMDENDFKFMKYVVEFSKEYKSIEEYNLRKDNYFFMDAEIAKLNATEGITSTHGHNFLSDYTREEYRAMLGLRNVPKPERRVSGPRHTEETNSMPGIPTSWNWCPTNGNNSNATCNAIKNQGACGSCWAFSTNASMESAHAIFYGTLYSLSEQQLVSCSSAYGNNGCGGGWYYWAWEYAAVTPITTEAIYPYTSGTFGVTHACTYQSGTGVMYDSTQTDVTGTTSAITTAAYQQVLSVAIEADQPVFQSYTGGVITSSTCGTNIDHAVAIVGYNQTGNYYIVRNSWGSSWGNSGYVWIGMSSGAGICGINQYVAYPTVKK
jgi:C1A family cysteine protease